MKKGTCFKTLKQIKKRNYLEHAKLIILFKVEHIMVMVCMFGKTHGDDWLETRLLLYSLA